ncbi:MAG: Na+/H+ antiporter family protein [Bacillus sp. (in: firmicutes)]
MVLNAVLVSVLVMLVLSLLRLNVIFSIFIAAMTAGLLSGMDLIETTTVMINGMGGQMNTALSYIFLGIFAVMIGMSGITGALVNGILTVMKGKKAMLLFLIAGFACLSQNIIPVHIAFIPILIPPLLALFNKLKIDRRAVAVALTFGLVAPYITIPVGFGLIFQGIIKDEMVKNGMDIALSDVTIAMLIPGAGMIVGLLVALFISYRKQRSYGTSEVQKAALGIFKDQQPAKWGILQWCTIFAIIAALGIQLWTDSLVLGALAGIAVMFITKVVPMREADGVVNDGIAMMGMIAFVMLIASGYASVLETTGAVDALVEDTTALMGSSKMMVAFFILLIGLIVTMGIGTSFGTVPILAAIYVPICAAVGFSPLATAALVGTAGALGDAGSPASDSTLGPTSGLNADSRHNHIWDTCVPTFLHYNIPLFIFGMIAAYLL